MADRPFVIARLKYGGGGDWYVSRTAIPNLLEEVGEMAWDRGFTEGEGWWPSWIGTSSIIHSST